MNPEKPALYFYERLFALSTAGFFALLIALNICLSEKKIIVEKQQHPSKAYEPLIQVTILGKVNNPGTYQVKKGTPVREVLQMAEPMEDAKIHNLKQDKTITRKRKIIIR